MDPQEAINKIKLGIHSQTKKQSEGGNIALVHHILMRMYGWIPLKEFNKFPLPTLWGLLDCIMQEKEAEEKAMKKTGRKR